jgi:hypothetical protein
MGTILRSSMAVALGVLFAFSLVVSSAEAQSVTRFAANFQASNESCSNQTPDTGGKLLYDQTIKVPANINTLFITITGASDTQSDSEPLLNCQVDGAGCHSTSAASNASPADWTNLLIDPSGTDSEDHSFSYTWCAPLRKESKAISHEIKINLANTQSSMGLSGACVERVLVTVDGAKIANSALACTSF